MSSLVPLLVSGLALLFGSAVEAATGYGSAVVALPVMELAFPSHMPALLILLGPPLIVLMVGIERRYIDASAAVQISSGLIFGTVLAIPPLAVVFAHEHGPAVRSTLGVIYGIASAFSIGALLIARRIDTTDLWLAAVLTVPVVAGFGAGRLLLNKVSKRFLHLAVLAVVSGCALILLLGAV